MGCAWLLVLGVAGWPQTRELLEANALTATDSCPALLLCSADPFTMIDLSIYVELMQILFTTSSAAFGAHRAALLATPNCQQALLDVLLHPVLPSLAATLEAARSGGNTEFGNTDSSSGMLQR